MTDDLRPTDNRRPTDERPPVRFSSRLPTADSSPLIPIAALALLVAIATVTTRAAGPAIADRPGPAGRAVVGTGPGSPSPPMPATDAAVATICLQPGSWRTATIETWRDQTVHVWRAIDPRPASGPDDPAIPIVPAVGSRVAAIGFCAPVVGPEMPAGPVTIEAWRRDPAGASDRGAATAAAAIPIELPVLVPTGSPSPFGALFGPPEPVRAAGGWSPGVVVFRYAPTAPGPTSAVTWFGIEVALTEASGQRAPSPDPAVVPTSSPLRP